MQEFRKDKISTQEKKKQHLNWVITQRNHRLRKVLDLKLRSLFK